MQQLIAWVVSIFLFTSLVVSSSLSFHNSFLKRDEKQNINLLGKEIVNHIRIDDNSNVISVDKERCLKSIKSMSTSQNVIGMLFVFNDRVIGIDEEYKLTESFDCTGVSEVVKVSYVNKVLNVILANKEIVGRIEIADRDIESIFFNQLEDELTVFLVSKTNGYLNVSGFGIS